MKSKRLAKTDIDGDDVPKLTWISVDERRPSHIYTVVIWVVGGPLINLYKEDGGYLDVGIYSPLSGEWKAHDGNGDDHVVEVSHWMEASPPGTPTEE